MQSKVVIHIAGAWPTIQRNNKMRPASRLIFLENSFLPMLEAGPSTAISRTLLLNARREIARLRATVVMPEANRGTPNDAG